jgi:septum site-determining protein MinC
MWWGDKSGMTKTKSVVTIKGTKDGLVFLMNDTCSLEELFIEMKEKVEHSHQQILSGPLIQITIQLGNRYLTPEQEKQLRDIIKIKSNLVVRKIETSVLTKEQAVINRLASITKIETRTLRSGQELRHDGDLLLLGDINPGGGIYCTGSIFVLGALRGLAHAGCEGNENAIIAASELKPTQLRIAGVISRPPDEWMDGSNDMEFAYLENGQMSIDKINQVHKVKGNIWDGKQLSL